MPSSRRRRARRRDNIVRSDIMARFDAPDTLVLNINPTMVPAYSIMAPVSVVLNATVDTNSPPVAVQLKILAPPSTNPQQPMSPAVLWVSGERLVQPGRTTRLFGRWPPLAWPQASDRPSCARLEVNCLRKAEKSIVTVVGELRLKIHGIDHNESCPAG